MNVSHLEQAYRSFDKKKYNQAMMELICFLTECPDNKEARELAQTILSICMVKNPPERLRDEIIYDHLLDPLFAQCEKCRTFWPVNPFLKDAASVMIMHPLGGFCPKCNNVYCASCAGKNGGLECLSCHTSLTSVIIPNGRKQQIEKQKKKQGIRYALIFKEPPEPVNLKSYLQLVLEAICPEALTPGVELYAETTKGPVDQMYALTRTMYVKPDVDMKKFDLFTQNFSDKDGGKGILLKIYDKK